MKNPEEDFALLEKFISSFVFQIKRDPGGAIQLQFRTDGQAWIDSERLYEHFVQKYVGEQYKRLGFSKIEGPFDRGPDFRVMATGKKRWQWAEVETRWDRYLNHGHHLSGAFADTAYLIVLSDSIPPQEKRRSLPPNIVYIDHKHFALWFEVESRAEMNVLRIDAVASAMQEHWVTICPDTERDMATCPNCDDCPYFGEGISNEASPFFQRLAAILIKGRARGADGAIDLRKVRANDLQRFVETHPQELP